MTTKPNRHAMVEAICQWCGEKFMARKQRVDKGQSRFCSMKHYREHRKSIGSQRKNIGKENAIVLWDEPKKMYVAYWYDEVGKYHSAGWARWWWELNRGDVPEGYRVSYKDSNSKNATPENIFLISREEYAERQGRILKGKPFSEEHKRAIRDGRIGMKLSLVHRVNIGNAQKERWIKGEFDSVHKGANNKNWRGGVPKPYPREFYEIKDSIKERDRYTCQICGKSVYRSRHGHVHHIDGNKNHNNGENLILLCSTCHSKIHMDRRSSSPVILAFQSKLEWNHNDLPEEQ
jgi:hypothetical protein